MFKGWINKHDFKKSPLFGQIFIEIIDYKMLGKHTVECFT